MWFMSESLFVWMVIAHVAFLVVPGLLALAYDWHQESVAREKVRQKVMLVRPHHKKAHHHPKAA